MYHLQGPSRHQLRRSDAYASNNKVWIESVRLSLRNPPETPLRNSIDMIDMMVAFDRARKLFGGIEIGWRQSSLVG
jgi:hypothetical protein